MSLHCSGEPVSWLRLERYHLGELPEQERVELTAHLKGCEACRASLEAIEGDDRALPPLPTTESAPRESWLGNLFGPRWAPVLAAAAAVLLAVVLAPELERGDLPPSRITLKGGDLAISLVRERDGVVVEDPEAYRPGDRLQVRLTCPEKREPTRWDVVVFQAGETLFPLADPQPLRCGNKVMLPGAFRLTGGAPAAVCLIVGEELPARAELGGSGLAGLPRNAVCALLAPAPR